MVDLEFPICSYDIKFDHMDTDKPFSQKCAQIKIFQLIVKPTDARVGWDFGMWRGFGCCWCNTNGIVVYTQFCGFCGLWCVGIVGFLGASLVLLWASLVLWASRVALTCHSRPSPPEKSVQRLRIVFLYRVEAEHENCIFVSKQQTAVSSSWFPFINHRDIWDKKLERFEMDKIVTYTTTTYTLYPLQLSPGQIDGLAIGNGWSGGRWVVRSLCSSMNAPPPLSVRQQLLCHPCCCPCVTPLSLLLLLLLLLLPHLASHLSKGRRMNYSNLCPLITPSRAAVSRPTGKTFLTAFFRHFFAPRWEWGAIWESISGLVKKPGAGLGRLIIDGSLTMKLWGGAPGQSLGSRTRLLSAERPILLLLPYSWMHRKRPGAQVFGGQWNTFKYHVYTL